MRLRLDIRSEAGVTVVHALAPAGPSHAAPWTPGMVMPPGFTLELTRAGAQLLDPKGKRRPVLLTAPD